MCMSFRYDNYVVDDNPQKWYVSYTSTYWGFCVSNTEEKVRELHNLGIIAKSILKKPDNEPRTTYKILPSGKAVIVFYSSCFSFISNNENQLSFPAEDIDIYLQKARSEVGLLKSLQAQPGVVPPSFKSKPYIIPFIIYANGTKRLYKVHLCKEHRKDTLTYIPRCTCYLTWEDIGDKDE